VNKLTRQIWSGFFSKAVFAVGLIFAAVDPAGSTSKVGPTLDPVRLACKITGPTAAAFGLSDHVLCNEARLAIQELADGQIDRNVAQVEGWSTFANPNKKNLLQECQKQDGPVGGAAKITTIFCTEVNRFLSPRSTSMTFGQSRKELR
jgi:hypothetical protein